MPIIPNNQRTREQLREMGRKGGLTKAENARKRRAALYSDYSDIKYLRVELWRVALILRDVIAGCDQYEDNIYKAKCGVNAIIETLEKDIQNDNKRTTID